MIHRDHIVLKNISKTFDNEGRTLLALTGVHLTIAEGEFFSVLGPSGCGKTTLLRIVGGLLQPTTGEVSIGGRDPLEAQAQKEIGFVFQDSALLPWRSVIGNVMLPLQVNRRDHRGGPRRPDELVDLVGLGDFAEYYPHQLSGGMKQRVALARALVFDPALLLMDEPLGSLDELTRSAMRYELLRIWEVTHKTVVMVTHSIAEAVLMSDRVAVMTGQPGQIAGIVPVELARPRGPGAERTQAFLDHVEYIQTLLAKGGPVGAAAAPRHR